jgi:hypothetical protein
MPRNRAEAAQKRRGSKHLSATLRSLYIVQTSGARGRGHMAAIVGDQCRSCRFFWPLDDDQDRGECRRFPRTVFPVKLDGNQLAIRTEFPVTVTTGWCGEYQTQK